MVFIFKLLFSYILIISLFLFIVWRTIFSAKVRVFRKYQTNDYWRISRTFYSYQNGFNNKRQYSFIKLQYLRKLKQHNNNFWKLNGSICMFRLSFIFAKDSKLWIMRSIRYFDKDRKNLKKYLLAFGFHVLLRQLNELWLKETLFLMIVNVTRSKNSKQFYIPALNWTSFDRYHRRFPNFALFYHSWLQYSCSFYLLWDREERSSFVFPLISWCFTHGWYVVWWIINGIMADDLAKSFPFALEWEIMIL